MSLAYNIGEPTLYNTKMFKYHKAGDFQAAHKEIDMVKITNPKTGQKEVCKGLVNRRCADRELYLKGGGCEDLLQLLPKPKTRANQQASGPAANTRAKDAGQAATTKPKKQAEQKAKK